MDSFGSIVSGTEGYIHMIDNWLAEGGETIQSANKVPFYDYTVEEMDPALALQVQKEIQGQDNALMCINAIF